MTIFDLKTPILGDVAVHLDELEDDLDSHAKNQVLLVKAELLEVLMTWQEQHNGQSS